MTRRLSEKLTCRSSLVFVSAWPEDYERNDSDSAGMHGMFEKCNMPFSKYDVIDNRMKASCAAGLIREASCIFLMGGHPGLQIGFIRDNSLDVAICGATAAVLGVSAGAINMAKRSLDTKESPVPYKGLGMADITVKPHFEPGNRHVLAALLQISMGLPICAMEDDSAIFAQGGRISYTGRIHWVDKGKIHPFSQGNLLLQG